ncbi:MAG: 4,5-DOPA dioxygenase extradiol [Ferrovum sp.]|nr:4,5-DOPA dioxygenase extradiol [Ferrovum sp.]NDU87790.1 4,5-DOPA dioxygenase extradiol [Ferrovum sp.]
MPTQPLPHPALFLGHGTPMHAIAPGPVAMHWREMGKSLPRPSAIVVISAHWTLSHCAVTAMSQPRTIHDFGGFPRALYQIQYPCPGQPDLARRIADLLHPLPLEQDMSWGLDHGAWAVLKHLYPAADIPVIEVALDLTQPPIFHYELGQRLAHLRSEQILLLGSGNIVHHLGAVRWEADAPAHPWAQFFDNWVVEKIRAEDHGALLNWENWPEAAHLAVPTPEHFLPLLVILGSKTPADDVSFPWRGIEMSAISMTSVQLG